MVASPAPPAPPRIFAPARREAVQRRAMRLQQRRDAARYLFADIAEDVTERLGFLRHRPERTLVIGDLSGEIGRALAASGVVEARPGAFDPEQPWPEQGHDLVVAAFALDRANDLPGALIHARNALAPGGLMLATMLGAGSLTALRAIMLAADGERPSPRLHPQVDVRAGAQLLQRAGFANPVADSRTLEVRFASLGSLLADLRAQGLSSALARGGPPPGKAGFARARAAFDAAGDEAGRVTERFELLTLTGWRR